MTKNTFLNKVSKFIDSVKPGSQVFTQEGMPVRIICTDRKGKISEKGALCPIVGLVDDGNKETCLFFTAEGVSSKGGIVLSLTKPEPKPEPMPDAGPFIPLFQDGEDVIFASNRVYEQQILADEYGEYMSRKLKIKYVGAISIVNLPEPYVS